MFQRNVLPQLQGSIFLWNTDSYVPDYTASGLSLAEGYSTVVSLHFNSKLIAVHTIASSDDKNCLLTKERVGSMLNNDYWPVLFQGGQHQKYDKKIIT
jgi:hypothetical protein